MRTTLCAAYLLAAALVVNLLTMADSRNCSVLLNVAPNKQGRFDDTSVRVPQEVGGLLAGKQTVAK